MTLGKITSQVVEVENSGLKQHGFAPGPKDGIDKAHSKIADRNAQKTRFRKRRAAINMMKKPAQVEDRANRVLKLSRHGSDKLFEQWKASKFCACHRLSGTKCCVQYEHKEEERGSLKENHKVMTCKNRQLIRKRWLLPRLEVTRIVEIFICSKTGQLVVKCSCGLFDQEGLKCRHIYAVFGDKPVETDATYCYWLDFDLAFLDDGLEPDLLKKIWTAHALWENTEGTVLPEGTTEIPEFESDEDIDYFEKTLDRPSVVEAGYWKTRRGALLVQKAEHIASSYKENTIHHYGMISIKVVELQPRPSCSFCSICSCQQC